MRLFLNPLRSLITKLKHFANIRSKQCNFQNLNNIIPAPQSVFCSAEKKELANCQVYSLWPEALEGLGLVSEYLQKVSGSTWTSVDYKEEASISIELDSTIPKEGYKIEIKEGSILILASTRVGVLYGLYSIAGSIENLGGVTYIPSTLSVSDYPLNTWRGIHVDVARNFFEVKVLYELIDLFSFYKINKFHLHLTDDQGWRFESKKYPRLHEAGAKRKETVVGKHFPFFGGSYLGDQKPVTGYYTQSELRALDRYALDRGIEIVPEIDIPGHATSALVAYPEYAAYKAPTQVATYWGVFNNVFSPSESSVNFLFDIFDELASVFSSKYIHIGGDEVPAKNYKKDIVAKSLIRKGIVSSFDKVDTYILDKVAEHIVSIGKVPVLWDEGREVALKHNGVTMVWRDNNYAKEVLAQGGKVVLCPTSHFYFDYYQRNPETEPLAIGGYLPIEQVYSYIPPDPGKGAILGIQANLWTEYIQTPEHLIYMLKPRIYALSEVSWGTNSQIHDFLRRVSKQNKI